MHPRAVPIALAFLLAVPALPGAATADDRGISRHGGFRHHEVRHDGHRDGHQEARHEARRDGDWEPHHREARHDGRDRYERHRYDGHIEVRRDFGVRASVPRRYTTHRSVRHSAGWAAPRHFPPPGHRYAALPRTHLRLVLGNTVYFYFDGIYATPRFGAYVVVGAPIGARVRYLPAGYVSFFLGPRRYFFVNSTYYLWDDRATEYVVVDKPPSADDALAATDGGADELFVYPAEGQTDAQRDRDRYACHEWAVTETGRDAWRARPGDDDHDDYLRALGACLQARGYAVR